MRSAPEAFVFVGLAVAAHVALAVSIDLPGFQVGALPEQQERRDVTVSALAGGVNELVDRWEQTPDVADGVAALGPVATPEGSNSEVAPDVAPTRAAPVSQVVPAVRDAGGLPTLPSAPARVVAEAADTAPAAPVQPGTASSPSVTALRAPDTAPSAPRPLLNVAAAPGQAPVSPQAPLPPRARVAPAERPDPDAAEPQVASPLVEQEAAPASEQASAPPQQAVLEPSLITRWESRIQARIQSRLRRPPGVWPDTQAIVRIRVTPDGRVLQAFLTQLTGEPRLDSAAIDAVRRAGRLPRAPRGIPPETTMFNIALDFSR